MCKIIRKFVHITIRVLSSVFLGQFMKASYAKHLLLTKRSLLKKWTSILILGIFSIVETNKIKGEHGIRTVHIYILTEIVTEKSCNSLFQKDQTKRTRNILKALHVCNNSGFKHYFTFHNRWQSHKRIPTVMNYYGGSYEDL